ncbi:MAG: hypothetical protein J7J07_08690, partial [Syntrophobacterales bacterium]|nr:hypothetical protein [Syntrophobacterales bacterium]
AQILILEISNIFLWLKSLSSLNLNKIEHSAKVSDNKSFIGTAHNTTAGMGEDGKNGGKHWRPLSESSF